MGTATKALKGVPSYGKVVRKEDLVNDDVDNRDDRDDYDVHPNHRGGKKEYKPIFSVNRFAGCVNLLMNKQMCEAMVKILDDVPDLETHEYSLREALRDICENRNDPRNWSTNSK